MYQFSVHEKAGFTTSDRDIDIFDGSGKPFYHKINRKGILRFNLPSGNYQTKNRLTEIDPVVYLARKVPPPQKRIPFRNLKVNIVSKYEGDNGKARINTIAGEMDLREDIFCLPKPVWKKIFFHELGHHLYYDEHLCDHFADLCLLKMGFNPSQLFNGTVCSLKPEENNLERIVYNHYNGMKTRIKK